MSKLIAVWSCVYFSILFVVGIMYSISVDSIEGIMCSLSFLGLAIVFKLIENML